MFFISNALAEEIKNDITYRVIPTLSSNPTSGTGAGINGVTIYKADEQSSSSQGVLGGKYTNTDSYNLFIANKMFLKEDKWQSKSLLGYMNNNTQYDFPSDFLTPTIPNFINIDDGIKYNAKVYVTTQQILYKL